MRGQCFSCGHLTELFRVTATDGYPTRVCTNCRVFVEKKPVEPSGRRSGNRLIRLNNLRAEKLA